MASSVPVNEAYAGTSLPDAGFTTASQNSFLGSGGGKTGLFWTQHAFNGTAGNVWHNNVDNGRINYSFGTNVLNSYQIQSWIMVDPHMIYSGGDGTIENPFIFMVNLQDELFRHTSNRNIHVAINEDSVFAGDYELVKKADIPNLSDFTTLEDIEDAIASGEMDIATDTALSALIARNLAGDMTWSDNGTLSWDDNGYTQTASIADFVAQSYMDFDDTTGELIITRPGGSEKRVDLSALIPAISGDNTATINTSVSNGVIVANINNGSVTNAMLATAVQNALTLAGTALQSIPQATQTVRGGINAWLTGSGATRTLNLTI